MQQPTPAQLFLLEADDLLAGIEEITLELQDGAAAGDRVHQLFRAFHTIKGSGAMFGFDAVAAFTHHVETVLDQVRDGTMPVTRELIELILASRDQIRAMLADPQQGSENARKIAAALEGLPHSGGPVPVAEKCPARAWRILFRPNADLFLSGTNPALLLEELRSLGPCTVEMHSEDVPPLAEMQPDRCFLWWNISLQTDRSLDEIRDVFLFLPDDSSIEIVPTDSRELPDTEPAAGAAGPAGNLCQKSGADETVPDRPPVIGEIQLRAVDSSVCPRFSTQAAKPPLTDSTVRVPSERLDRLVNLVGELVVNQSRLRQAVPRDAAADLAAPVEEIERLIDELRDHVLAIRMMPIETTFRRFKRLVHDLSAELG